MIAVVGVLYAVLLASIAILALETFNHAEEAVEREASLASDLYRDAVSFPNPAATALRAELRAYGEVVVNEEWPAMRAGVKPDMGWPRLERLQTLLIG